MIFIFYFISLITTDKMLSYLNLIPVSHYPVLSGVVFSLLFNSNYVSYKKFLLGYNNSKILIVPYKKDDKYYYNFTKYIKYVLCMVGVLYSISTSAMYCISHNIFNSNILSFTAGSFLLNNKLDGNFKTTLMALLNQAMISYCYILGGKKLYIPITIEIMYSFITLFYFNYKSNNILSAITFKGEVPESLTEEDYNVLKERN